jgi:hypothetical protein
MLLSRRPSVVGRTVLAFAAVSRHPGVAIAVASLADQPLAPIGADIGARCAGIAFIER